MSAKPAILELQPDAFLSLRNFGSTTLTCLEGVLWVTYDGERRDFLLYPGDSHEIARAGAAVQALAASRMAVRPAGLSSPVPAEPGQRSRSAGVIPRLA